VAASRRRCSRYLARASTTVGCSGTRRLLPNLVRRICNTPSGICQEAGGLEPLKCEPSCSNQPQQRPVDLAPKRVRLAKPTGRPDELPNLLGRVDVGRRRRVAAWSGLSGTSWARSSARRKRARCTTFSQPNIAGVGGRSRGGPVRRRRGVDVCVAPVVANFANARRLPDNSRS